MSDYNPHRPTGNAIFVALLLPFAFLLLPFSNLPTDARALDSSRVPFLLASDNPKVVPLVEHVGAIGMTVSDTDASIDFYSRVLSFEKVSDVEVTGEDECLFGMGRQHVEQHDRFIEPVEIVGRQSRGRVDAGVGQCRRAGIRGLGRRLPGVVPKCHGDPILEILWAASVMIGG